MAREIRGIDVSHHQKVVNWLSVAQSGFPSAGASHSMQFAYAKATEGASGPGTRDTQFAANWANIRAAGLLRGAYHFFSPTSSGARQAANFLAVVPRLDYGDLPPVLDLECPKRRATDHDPQTVTECLRGVSLNTVLGRIAEWLQTVEQTLGRKPIIYTFPNYFEHYLNNATTSTDSLGNLTTFADYLLWVAHHRQGASPRRVNGWRTHSIWQFTEKGRVAGVTGNVDINKFNGSLKALMGLAGQGRPSGYIFPHNVQHVVCLEPQGTINELWWDGRWHSHILNPRARAPYAVSNPSGYNGMNVQRVVYRSVDGHIHELWWNNRWNHTDLTAITGAPLADGEPTCNGANNVCQVVYRGTDRHVHMLFLQSGRWQHSDFSATVNAPNAVGDIAVYTLGLTQHWVYRGADDRIHELWTDTERHYNGLSATTNAPPAVGDPYGYTYFGTQHVVYRSANGHIQELWWDDTWRHNDLSQATQSPAAAGDPVGYALGNTQNVVYRGINRHIHLLSFQNDAWRHRDLNTVMNAREAAGDPGVYTWGATAHIVYRGTDGHMQELWWDGTWHHNDLTLAAIPAP